MVSSGLREVWEEPDLRHALNILPAADEAGALDPFSAAFSLLDKDRSGYVGSWELRVGGQPAYTQKNMQAQMCTSLTHAHTYIHIRTHVGSQELWQVSL
jgi:hypothetical protein